MIAIFPLRKQTVHICVPPCHQQCLYTMYTIHGVHSFCDVYRSWLNQVLQYVPSSSLFSMLPREGQRLEQSRWIWNHHPSRKATNRRNPTTWEYWPYLGTLPNFPLQCSLQLFLLVRSLQGMLKVGRSKSDKGGEYFRDWEVFLFFLPWISPSYIFLNAYEPPCDINSPSNQRHEKKRMNKKMSASIIRGTGILTSHLALAFGWCLQNHHPNHSMMQNEVCKNWSQSQRPDNTSAGLRVIAKTSWAWNMKT